MSLRFFWGLGGWGMMIVDLLGSEEERPPSWAMFTSVETSQVCSEQPWMLQGGSSVLPTAYMLSILFIESADLSPKYTQRFKIWGIISFLVTRKIWQVANSKFSVKSRQLSPSEKITELNWIHAIYERDCFCFHPKEADGSFSPKWPNERPSFPNGCHENSVCHVHHPLD